ncbi:MAG: glycosyltransferase [Pseudomonadota bacterium]|nr:glycosyltransferase [Pseudomonadota bacterium]
MTKILQVMAGAAVGGAEEFFMRLVPALANANIEQRVALRRHAERERILRESGIQTLTAKFGGPFDFATARSVQHAINDFSPDVVLAWMNRATRFIPRGRHIFAARLGGYYDLKYYRHCDHLIGNTEAIRDYLIAKGWPKERAWYIPNFADGRHAEPVDRSAIDTPTDVILLLALGRLHENKAFDILIDALANIPRAYLWIAGDGPRNLELRLAAQTHGVTERVRFLGWRNDTPALLAAADILICPSRHEPLGNVIIEAWAHDTPVVAASSDGPRNLIKDGKTGLLVPIDDATALARAVNYLIEDPKFGSQLACAGLHEYQTSYTEDIVVRQYQDFFEKVVI